MKKKLYVLALVAAAAMSAPASASGDSVLCSGEAVTFNQWFYQVFYC